MNVRLVKWGAVVGMLALVAACGGGGGGGGGGAPVAKASTATVSGTAIAVSAFASKASNPMEGVAIDVVSYKNDGTELGRGSVTTDSNGGFGVSLPLWSGGGYLVVTAKKDGFADFTKRIDYKTPQNIELQAALNDVYVAFSNISGSSNLIKSADGSRVKGFSFAVVKYPNGVKKAVAGKAVAAAKAAGAVTELQLDIPAASLPNVSKLKGELQTFEPATESSRFPGSYTGVVNGREGKMVSLAFDFMKITDVDSGENIGVKASKLAKAGLVKKSAATQSVVTRHIYTSSCENLFLEDYDKTTSGHQVPVWSLNPSSGKWVFIGVGTVVDSNADTIQAPTKENCGNGGYYLKIPVDNKEFAKSWWNLDHIVFDTPTEVCVKGKATYSDGTPVENLFLSVNGANLDSAWTRTAADGTYTLTSVLLNKTNSNRTGTLNYWDENGAFKQISNVTFDSSPNCTTKDFTLTKPCRVEGKLVSSTGGPGVPYRWLSLQGSGFYRGVTTDANGGFSSNVACDTPITVYSGDAQLATFTVNGTPETKESSDDGVKSTLVDLLLPNTPPYGYAYLSSYSIKTTGSIRADISGYDVDGDYPVTYRLKFGSDQKATGSFSGFRNFTTATISGLSAGTYPVTLELSDSKNAPRTVSVGTVEVNSGDRPPVVTAFASPAAVNLCSSNQQVTLYGRAYDPDGDTVTGSWPGTTCTGTGQNASQTGTTGFVSVPCTVTVGNDTTFTFTAGSASQSVRVTTFAPYPWIKELTSDKAIIINNNDATGENRKFTVTATALHPDGVNVTGTWSADGLAFTCPNVTLTPSSPTTTCTFTVPDTVTTDQIFEVKFTAEGCSRTAERTVRIFFGTPADVNLTVN